MSGDRPVPNSSAEDRAAIESVRESFEAGERGLPSLLRALDTKSWLVRRHVIEALANLGEVAADALCESLRSERTSETRIAAVVDALSASLAALEPRLLEMLAAANSALVCDAAQILGRRRAIAALPALSALTAHDDDNVAVASIEALGNIGGPAAVRCLLPLLDSPNFFRSFPAIDVLGRLGDTAAVAPLVALVPDPLRGAEAARALGRLGDETALPALLRSVHSGSSAAARVAAVALNEINARSSERYGSGVAFERAVAALGAEGTLSGRLERALAGADPSEQRAFSDLLGYLPGPESVEALVSLLTARAEVAASAAASLGRLSRKGDESVAPLLTRVGSEARALLIPHLAGSKPAVPGLVSCLGDADVRVRILACEALARTGDTSVVSALFSLLDSSDLALSQAATGAIQSLGSSETQALALAGTQSAVPAHRRAAMRIVAYFGYPSGLPVLLAASHDEDPRLREIALSGLSLVEDPQALAALLDESEASSARTRAAAVRALGATKAEPRVVARLRAATDDVDPWVRYYACQALGNLGDESSAGILLGKVDDPAGQVRVAAVDAISRLPGAAVAGVLARACEHRDLEVRRAALAGAGVAKSPELLPLLLHAATADDVATRLVALSSLAKFTDEAATARIAASAEHDRELTVRHAAVELMSEDAGARTTSALVDLLRLDELRPRLLDALARHAEARAPHLVSELDSATSAVADSIVGVLSRLEPRRGEKLLMAALESTNVLTRRAAARALAIAHDSDAVQSELFRVATHDPDPEVRRLAMARLS